MNNTISLISSDILSKWGFADGSKLADLLFDHGIYADYRDLLVIVVKRYLLPQLKNDVKVFTIGTCHNPIRAESVDGVDVDDIGDNSGISLSPDSVEVSVESILDLARMLEGNLIDIESGVEINLRSESC